MYIKVEGSNTSVVKNITSVSSYLHFYIFILVSLGTIVHNHFFCWCWLRNKLIDYNL